LNIFSVCESTSARLSTSREIISWISGRYDSCIVIELKYHIMVIKIPQRSYYFKGEMHLITKTTNLHVYNPFLV